MHDLPPLNSLERELEARLGQLSPAPHQLNRDKLMFRAGEAAGERSARRWRSTTLTGLVMAMLGLAWTTPWIDRDRMGPAGERLAANTDEAVEPPAAPVFPDSPPATRPVARIPAVASPGYLHLRERVLRQGLEALPSVRWAPLPDTAGITAGSWRPRRAAGNRIEDPFWQGNLNDRNKQS